MAGKASEGIFCIRTPVVFIYRVVRWVIVMFLLFSATESAVFAQSAGLPEYSISSGEASHHTFPLSISWKVAAFAVSGEISLWGINSIVRVVLLDEKGNEYLVYEAYPLIVDGSNVRVDSMCEETCSLPQINPDRLRLEVVNASVRVTGVGTSGNFHTSEKLGKLRENIRKKNLPWKAGETPISRKSYSEKKALFRTTEGATPDALPNLGGFEYYTGGVFDTYTDGEQDFSDPSATGLASGLPDSWDWRNRHGQNWLTTVKDQGPYGTCYYFSMAGALESVINLFYNSHIDMDLSEQSLSNCAADSRQWDNGCFGGAICTLQNIGVVDEACVPYAGTQGGMCEIGCQDYAQHVWKPSSYRMLVAESYAGRNWQMIPINASNGDESIKRRLIQYGPMEISGVIEWHSMVLAGYKTDPIDGRTIYIVKNSWGPSWGEGGYAEIKVDPAKYNLHPEGISANYYLLPVIGPQNNVGISCVDSDSDGYCSWGLMESKPSDCPVSCRPQKDCDDSDSARGPFDGNYNCTPGFSPTQGVPMPGDANADGLVDETDYEIWEAHYMGTYYGSAFGDFDNDSIVNAVDYAIWLFHYGVVGVL